MLFWILFRNIKSCSILLSAIIINHDLNFCRLVEEGFSVEASEDVSVLHNADEDVCRKHLKSFSAIAEIGFPSKDVHQALIAASFDHQKALDQLIR